MDVIKKNYVFNLVLTLSNILFPIITIPYVSRILGPVGIGKTQFIYSISQYFVLIAALGIPVYGTREIAKVKSNKLELSHLFTSIVIINLFTVILVSIIFYLMITTIDSFQAERKLFLISSTLIFFSFANIDWFYAGIEKYKYITIRSIFVKIVFAVLLFYYVKNEDDLLYYMIILVGSSVLNNLLNIILSRQYINLNKLSILQLFKHIKPLVLIFSSIFFASVYSTIDTFLLGFLKGYKDVGFYSASSRITKMTIPILTSMSAVLLPMLSVAIKEHDYNKIQVISRKSIDFVLLVAMPITVGLFFLSPELIRLFYGESFEPAILSLKIMSPIVLIIGLSTVFAVQILTPASLDSEVAKSVIIGLFFSLALNFILIPIIGFIGASISNITAEALVMFLFFNQTKKVTNKIINLTISFKYFLITLFFFPIIYFFRIVLDQNLFVVIFSIITCTFYYILVQFIFIKNENLINVISSFKKNLLND